MFIKLPNFKNARNQNVKIVRYNNQKLNVSSGEHCEQMKMAKLSRPTKRIQQTEIHRKNLQDQTQCILQGSKTKGYL